MEDTEKRKKYSQQLIQNDCETIKKIIMDYHDSIFIMGTIPYLALFCRSVGEYYNTTLISKEVDSEIYDLRNSLKSFSDKFGKTNKRFLLSDQKQDEEFRSKLRFNFLKTKNLYHNLGVFFTPEKKIIGNTQYFAFALKENGLSESERKEKALTTGFYLARIVRDISEQLKDNTCSPSFCSTPILPEVYYYDTNTNSTPFFYRHIGKYESLFLLHLLSNLGFVHYCLASIVDMNNPWLLRVEYIVTYSSYQGLKSLKNHFDNAKGANKTLLSQIEKIISDGDWLFDSVFRNCMMHYELVDNEHFCVSDDFFDANKHYYGLIEERFHGMSHKEYFDALTSYGVRIESFLETQFDIEHTKVKKL